MPLRELSAPQNEETESVYYSARTSLKGPDAHDAAQSEEETSQNGEDERDDEPVDIPARASRRRRRRRRESASSGNEENVPPRDDAGVAVNEDENGQRPRSHNSSSRQRARATEITRAGEAGENDEQMESEDHGADEVDQRETSDEEGESEETPRKAKRQYEDDEEREKEEKRLLRKEYRTLISSTEENSAMFIQSNSESLFNNIKKANELYTQVTSAQDATLDAKLLVLSADLGRHRARKMRLDHNTFDIDDYVAKLQTFLRVDHNAGDDVNSGQVVAVQDEEDDEHGISPQEEGQSDGQSRSTRADWARLGRLAGSASGRVPVPSFMLGPLSVEKKERKIIRHAQDRQRGEQRRPEELQQSDVSHGENDTTKSVMQIEQVLDRITRERGKPVNFFEFIVNPESFSQTVENLFYLSFLVRDGRVNISDDTGQPLLECCEPPTDEDRQNNLQKKQLVLDLDIETYRELIDVYNIRKPIIPTRERRISNLIASKWYG